MIINHSLPGSATTAAAIVTEILVQDCYRLATVKKIPQTVYDIGGNIGVFALAARFRWPLAMIHSYEPCPETFAVLRQNTAHFGIDCYHNALAVGAVRMERDKHSDGSHQAVVCRDHLAESYGMPLAQMVNRKNDAYLVKLDCEGGEKVVFQDPASLHALTQAVHWAMEYHPNLTQIPADRAFLILQESDRRARRERLTAATEHTDERWLFWSEQA